MTNSKLPDTLSERTERTQKLNTVLSLVPALLVLGAAFANMDPMLSDPDTYWHVKTGLDIFSTGVLPVQDVYSHSYYGQPWIAKEWLSQLFYAGAYSVGGWTGVAALAASALSLTAFLLCRLLSRELRPTIAIGVAVLAVLLVAPIWVARPHILSFPILIAWTGSLLGRSGRGMPPDFRSLLLLVLWVNMHAAFSIGLVIAMFAFLDFLERTRLRDKADILRWMIFGALCLLLTAATPYGFRVLALTLSMSTANEAVPLTIEWFPLDPAKFPIQTAALMIALTGLLVSGFRLGFARSLFIVAAVWMMLLHVRFVYLFFLLTPIVIAAETARQFPVVSAQFWRTQGPGHFEQWISRRFRIASSCMIGAMIVLLAAIGYVKTATPWQKIFPEQALQWIRQSPATKGNVLNSQNFGGPLIFSNIPTFVDGRTDQLFNRGFAGDIFKTFEPSGGPILRQQLENHSIGWVLLSPEDPRLPHFSTLDQWQEGYRDDNAVVLIRKNRN